jgi:hypothetical protein
VAAVGLGLCVVAPSAEAKLDADYFGNFYVAELTEVSVMNLQSNGGEDSCVGGMRAVSGGTFWDPVDDVDPAEAHQFWASSSGPIGIRDWYAAGGNRAGGSRFFDRYVQCLPKAKLRKAEVRIEDFPVDNLEHGGGRVRCPRGKRLYTGGAFWHDGDGLPSMALANDVWLSSSYPSKSGRTWYADGENRTGGDYVLRVIARCLPSSRFSNIKVRKTHDSIADGLNGGGERACPPGTLALTGGAYRHRAGKGPRPNNGADFWISSSFGSGLTGAPAAAWYADARNFSADTEEPWVLTVVAHCLT